MSEAEILWTPDPMVVIVSGYGTEWRAKVMRGPHVVRTFTALTKWGARRQARQYVEFKT